MSKRYGDMYAEEQVPLVRWNTGRSLDYLYKGKAIETPKKVSVQQTYKE